MYCVCTLFFFHFFPCVANPCTYIAQNQNVVYTIQSTHTYTFIRHTYCTAYVGILVVQYTPFTLCCDARQTENACACVCCCWCWCCYVPMLRVRMRMKLLSSTTTADSVCVCVWNWRMWVRRQYILSVFCVEKECAARIMRMCTDFARPLHDHTI